jgi:tripartite-type tricarboxylate transporter receptor subunit TctC
MKSTHGRAFCHAVALISLLCAGLPTASSAQDFPSRPITLTVGYGPGDNMDLMSRVLASRAEKILGQPIVVVNKPGAAGAVALTSLAKEKPDGYQLAAVIDSPLDRIPLLRKLGYKLDDFAPLLQFASSSSGVVVKSNSPWKSLPDLVKYAKENPGKVSYTTTGAGSTMHVAFQYIEKHAGLEWTHVPYPAAKQGLAAVLGGHVAVAVGSTQWVPEVKDGSMRLLAITSGKRMSAFPNVPTIRELGYDFGADSVSVIVAPQGVPSAVMSRLNDAFRRAMDDPEFTRLLGNLQLEVSYRNADELRKYLHDVSRDFARVIVDLRIPTEFDVK